jgi:PRTRC genetic system protein A
MFVNHIYAISENLPPFGDSLCEYVTAANGVFVRARRPGLEALLPVCWNRGAEIRGLAKVEPYVRLDGGRISVSAMAQALDWMRLIAPLELLTWIKWEAAGYYAFLPEQTTTASRCKPADPFDAQGQNALMDFHSHGGFPPFFSTTDDQDEKNGFRLFAVAGNFQECAQPAILVRVGIYGHFWSIPPVWVMELPDGIDAPLDEDILERSDEWQPCN